MPVASKNIPAPDLVPVRRALLSVSDKAGLIELATALADRNVELVSTGGTRKALADAGLPVTDVSEVTGFPEIMDGRVKTLHPAVHGGLLAVRDDPEHVSAMEENGIRAFDLAVINLYPFEQVVAAGSDYPMTIENIDIGGPAMVRAAAKNHAYLTVVTDTGDYPELLEMLAQNDGSSTLAMRKQFALRAFQRTASYDAMIAQYMTGQVDAPAVSRQHAAAGSLSIAMRYGENPHQAAGLYRSGDKRPGAASATLLQGKALSYNNINDTDAAFELVSEFDSVVPSVAIIKHANPCGVATGASMLEAYRKAYECDQTSAFGGIVALNGVLDAEAASEIVKIFTEVIIATGVTDEAAAIIAAKKNLRLLTTGALADPRDHGKLVKSVAGGLLVQDRDNVVVEDLDLKCVTKKQPSEAELADLKFAFKVAKHVKSNAIVYARDGATVGIGAGQMSRVDSARIAARKALDAAEVLGLPEPRTSGCVVASDAFFPFADGLLSAVEAGAKAVIQPGGSMRDDEVIAAADEHDIAMVFTGVRHFRH